MKTIVTGTFALDADGDWGLKKLEGATMPRFPKDTPACDRPWLCYYTIGQIWYIPESAKKITISIVESKTAPSVDAIQIEGTALGLSITPA